jgi:DNA-binding transcriptional regulator YhcF (GntR family)
VYAIAVSRSQILGPMAIFCTSTASTVPRDEAEPPYLQIVAELRRRVSAGELRAGDRIPSTRALARRWKVALATATKALAVLSQEGVVEAIPRVGTVVAQPKPGRNVPGAREQELSRDRIVAAAMAMADAQGIEGLSMRGVASRLDVPAMSLYRHIASKDELVGAMTDRAMGEERFPDPPPQGWRARLELGARVEWAVYRRHPWLVRLFAVTRPRPLPNALRYAEWMLGALEGLGLDSHTMMRIHITVHGYVSGIAANLEAEAQAAAESGLTEEEWMQTQEAAFLQLAASGAYPAFARVLRSLDDQFDLDLDEIFELGLRALLDGFTAMIEKRSASGNSGAHPGAGL